MTELSPLRVGRITGSRIATVLGLNKYATRDDLMRDMVREHFGAESEFKPNQATMHGQEHEDDALCIYERETGRLVHGGQALVLHPSVPYLCVTPDGLVGSAGMVEVKCPLRSMYFHIDERPDYDAQVRLQLDCTGREWCDFVIWRAGRIWTSRVEHDAGWLPTIRPVLDEFMHDFHEVINDPADSAVFLAPKTRRKRAAA